MVWLSVMRHSRLPDFLLPLTLLVLLAGCGQGQPGQPVDVPDSAPAQTAATFPLHVEPGKRYLVDAAGKPFLLNGDAPWTLIAQLTSEEAEQYLEDRRRKGINAVLVNLLEHHYADHPPRNVYGEAPFTTPGDLATPNEAYFSHADHVIRKAAEKGMLVLLAPAYVGYNGGDQGWYRELVANGASKVYAFGRYVGNRYKGFNNILWVQGGDYDVPDKDIVRAMANGIASVDHKPQTYHGSRGTAAMAFWGTGEPWLTVNDIYTDENTVVGAAFGEYARSDAPFFLIEARYEGTNHANEQTVRMQAYQAVLSGASGQTMGNNPLWEFRSGWREKLSSGGSRSLWIFSRFFNQLSWWKLQPDLSNTTLTDGIGSGADRAVAARASDGSFAVAYLPGIRNIAIDMSRLAGPRVNAQWVDPRSGARSAAPGSPFPASGTTTLRPDGNNSSGYGDWLLLLESTP